MRLIEPLCPVLDEDGIESMLVPLKLEDCAADGRFRLLAKEYARASSYLPLWARRDNRFQGPASPVGNHRSSTRLRLDRRHPKVLFSRKQQSPAPGVFAPQHLIRYLAEKFYAWSRLRSQTTFLRSTADNAKLPLQAITGRDDQVQPFVVHEAAHGEVTVPGFLEAGSRGVDGRIQHRAGPRVILPNAVCDILGVGRKHSDSLCGSKVPGPYIVRCDGEERFCKARQAANVVMVLRPQIAHRSVAITNVHSV